MAASPENSPRQDSNIGAEKPRSGADIFATRTYIGKLLNKSLHSRGIDVPTSIRRLQSQESIKDNLVHRYLLEYGKEEALNYAMRYQTPIEEQLKLKDNIKAENKEFIPIKTPQEIVNARIIISKGLDVTTMALYMHRDESTLLRFDMLPRKIDAEKGVRSLEEFSRVAGFYQGLSYLLGMENDGGMTELIERSDPKDFKLPPHP